MCISGWITQWSSSGSTKTKYNLGALGMSDFSGSSRFGISSGETSQSSLWSGTSGGLEVSAVTWIRNDDLVVTTQVKLRNIGSSPITNLYCKFLYWLGVFSSNVLLLIDLRTLDPDNELFWYKTYSTLNYVKYQPISVHAQFSTKNYTNEKYPNTALVIARGINNPEFYVGLLTMNAHARVSHFGFAEFDPPTTYANSMWTQYGGREVVNNVDESQMRNSDESIHLVYKYDSLAPGEVVQLSFSYIVSDRYEDRAISQLQSLIIAQPTVALSGKRALVSVVSSEAFARVDVFVFGTLHGEMQPRWQAVATITASSSVQIFSCYFDSTVFIDGSAQVKALAYNQQSVDPIS